MLFNQRKYRDSGEKVVTNTQEVTADNIFIFDIDNRFKPYNQVSIINNSNSDIGVSFNYKNDFSFLIPKGNQRILNIICQDVRFKNLGTDTILSNQIKLTIRHDGVREKQKITNNIQTISQVANIIRLIK